MRELELAGIPSIDPTRPQRDGRAQFPLSRTAFIASVAAHLLAGYALSRHVWPDASSPPSPIDGFLFEMPAPRPPEAVPATPPEEAVPEVREEREPAPEPTPAPEPAPRAAQPVPESSVVVEPPRSIEPAPSTEPAPAPEPRAYIDFDEARRRAANQVIEDRAGLRESLAFSMDDVAPPRPAPEPEKKSIFDGTGGTRGPSVGTLGQARTKFGHRVSALCNALTGGFSLMGFGSFCASPDSEPSGLFPEVRPAYLDLMPECVDTRDTAPALALEAPFPTIKCRLVEQEEVGRYPEDFSSPVRD